MSIRKRLPFVVSLALCLVSIVAADCENDDRLGVLDDPDLNGVAFADDRWVAAGQKGVVFADELFVAVGNEGKILSSPDGQVWTVEDSGVSADLRPVAWGDDLYVAVGRESVTRNSNDGITWF